MKLFMDRKRDWFVPVVGLLLVFILAARSPLDSDMWWHLKAGELTITNSRPYLIDSLSFTRFGEAWINHSWLSEVGMYIFFQLGGYLALGGIMALLATVSMGFVYFQSSGPAILKVFLLILGSIVAAVVWSPRPQLFSLVLLAIVSMVIYLFKWKQKNHLKWLPVIFFLWANLHGGYPLGLLLIGAVVAGEIAHNLFDPGSTQPKLSWPQVKQLILWSLISVFALLLNPNGLNIWKIPFQTVEVSALQQFIEEWASPDFHQLYQQPFLWLLFGILAAVGLSRRRTDFSDLAVVILFGYLALVARRNFGPFAIVAVPVLSRCLWAALKPGNSDLQTQEAVGPDNLMGQNRPRPRWQRRLNLFIVALLALVAFGKLYIVTYPGWMEAAIQASEPAGAVNWLQENGSKGQVLNEYNWGGYLEWRMQDIKVFVDGRTDLYGDSILNEWLGVVQAGVGWEQTLQKWKIDYILLDPNRPLVQAAAQKGWKLLYQDSQAVLYGK
jgi:hypothetical protein